MPYIIDANNLAGKLELLDEPDFDRQLIALIRDFCRDRGSRVILVFDGRDAWGDRSAIADNLEVIYAPRDEFYRSADDKIVEMVRGGDTNPDFIGMKKEIVVVTDDSELKKRLEKAAGETRFAVRLEQATDWAERMTRRAAKGAEAGDDGRNGKGGLSEREIGDINERLRRAWK